MSRTIYAFILAACAFLSPFSATAEDYVLTLKDHVFSPQELSIPADTKVKLTIRNEDSTPAEFESHDMKREKIVPAKGEVKLFLGPLKAGTYHFFDEFHPDTKGTVTVK